MNRLMISAAILMLSGCFKPIYDGYFPDGGSGAGGGGGGGTTTNMGGGGGGTTTNTGGGGGTTTTTMSDGGPDTSLEPGFYGTSEGYGQIYAHTADGGSWQASYRVPTDAYFYAIWGSGPNDVWLVGAPSLLLHFNGTTWVSHDNDAADYGAVWGSGPNDVWVVSQSWKSPSTLIHWNGHKWARVTVPEAGQLISVWGSGPSDVWVGGASSGGGDGGMAERAPIFRWNGSTWSRAATLDSPGFIGGWSSGPNETYARSISGVYRFNGSSWAVTSASNNPTTVWGSGPNDVWVSQYSGPIRRTTNGVSWSSTVHDEIFSVWVGGTSSSDIWAAGSTGKVIHRGSDGLWRLVDSSEEVQYIGGAMIAPGDPWLIDYHSVRRVSF